MGSTEKTKRGALFLKKEKKALTTQVTLHTFVPT